VSPFHRPATRSILGLAALVAAALAAFAPTPGRAADDKPLPLQMTKGSELTPDEDKQVRATLTHYLEALQSRNWREAAKDLDRESFLAGVDPLIASISSDSTTRPAAMRMVFGVSTKDSLNAAPTADLFASMMDYIMQLDPGGAAIMARAKFALLGARRLQDTIHIAYQLTIPAESDSVQPYTRITAEQLKQDGKDWKIVFRLGS
jgi:hypothetical protein